MTEWLREGIEGRSLKATLRLYLIGLMVLAPAAVLLALVFGGQASFVATPLLVLIVVAVEYTVSYGAGVRKQLEALRSEVRRAIEPRRYTSEPKPAVTFSNFETEMGMQIGTSSRVKVRDRLSKEEKALESHVHEMVYGRDASARASAAAALGAIGDRRAVDPLIDALKDKDASVRHSAAVALMRIGDLRAVEPLIIALGDEDASVRSSAVLALRRLPAVQKALDPDLLNKISRTIVNDESERSSEKEAALSPEESVRKRA